MKKETGWRAVEDKTGTGKDYKKLQRRRVVMGKKEEWKNEQEGEGRIRGETDETREER